MKNQAGNTIRLYDRFAFHKIPWPKSPAGSYARDYFSPLLQNGSQVFVKNVSSDFYILIINDKVVPVCLAGKTKETCYVCSPFDHYITYALEELTTLGKPVLAQVLGWIIGRLGSLLQWCRINRAVYVNNWLYRFLPVAFSRIFLQAPKLDKTNALNTTNVKIRFMVIFLLPNFVI